MLTNDLWKGMVISGRPNGDHLYPLLHEGSRRRSFSTRSCLTGFEATHGCIERGLPTDILVHVKPLP